MISALQDLLDRLSTYPWWGVAIEFVLIWLVVFAVVRFVQGTRAAGALKGIFVIFLVVFVLVLLARNLTSGAAFTRIGLLGDKGLAVIAVVLAVVFQPELRRALIRLGEAPFFRSSPTELTYIVDQIAEACAYLSKARFGALIVLERQSGLQGLTEGGTKLNAEVSARLLEAIFFPGSALHDLAVVIRGKVVHAAGVQLPLAEPGDMPDPQLGSRHRAAVGLSRECDAVVVIVSEETGLVRVSERGTVSPGLSRDELRNELMVRLSRVPLAEGLTEAEIEQEDALTGKEADR